MIHICRDYLPLPNTSTTLTGAKINSYLLSCFLRTCLGFTQIGHTNFNLSSSFAYFSGTNNANVNLGGVLQKAIQIPSGTRVVTVGDYNRILALKSNNHPLVNSGLFRIKGVDATTNSYLVDPRSWPDNPPVETNLSWCLYEAESIVDLNFSITPNASASTSYSGWGNAGASRIILQSPHSSSWQVRISVEDSTTVSQQTVFGATAIPGYNGNSAGDFRLYGQHLHPAMFWNISTTGNITTRGMIPAISLYQTSTTLNPRLYIWGDDETGSCFIVSRYHGNFLTEPNTYEIINCFGLAEDEQLPLPELNVQRLFAYGNTNTNQNDSITAIGITPSPRTGDSAKPQMGVAFGMSRTPVSCVPALWSVLTGQAANGNFIDSASATDSPILNATELLGIDLIAGTIRNSEDTNSNGQFYTLEPRRLGRMPFIRQGRKNFGNWSTSADGLWLHTQNGMYFPWSGSVGP